MARHRYSRGRLGDEQKAKSIKPIQGHQRFKRRTIYHGIRTPKTCFASAFEAHPTRLVPQLSSAYSGAPTRETDSYIEFAIIREPTGSSQHLARARSA